MTYHVERVGKGCIPIRELRVRCIAAPFICEIGQAFLAARRLFLVLELVLDGFDALAQELHAPQLFDVNSGVQGACHAVGVEHGGLETQTLGARTAVLGVEGEAGTVKIHQVGLVLQRTWLARGTDRESQQLWDLT